MMKPEGFLARGGAWVIAQFGLLVLLVMVPLLLPDSWPWPPGSAALRWPAGALLAALGLLLGASGAARFGRSLTPMPKPGRSGELVTEGPFRWIRHPIYSGLLLLSLGVAIVLPSALGLGVLVVLALVLDRKAAREEAWLTEQFSGYAAYIRRTRKFIPYLY